MSDGLLEQSSQTCYLVTSAVLVSARDLSAGCQCWALSRAASQANKHNI